MTLIPEAKMVSRRSKTSSLVISVQADMLQRSKQESNNNNQMVLFCVSLYITLRNKSFFWHSRFNILLGVA